MASSSRSNGSTSTCRITPSCEPTFTRCTSCARFARRHATSSSMDCATTAVSTPRTSSSPACMRRSAEGGRRRTLRLSHARTIATACSVTSRRYMRSIARSVSRLRQFGAGARATIVVDTPPLPVQWSRRTPFIHDCCRARARAFPSRKDLIMFRAHTRLAALVAIVALLPAAQTFHAQTPSHLALVGGMLLDGNEAPPIHHAAILIEGNKIIKVGPASEVKIPAGTTVIDTSGLTMMPGMIEAHAHLAILGHGEYGRWFAWLNEHKAQFPPERVFEISAKHLLMAGVTSAIDLGGAMPTSTVVRDRVARGEVPGPRLLVAGTPINHRNAPPNPAGSISLLGPGTGITTPAEAAAAVEEHVKQGVDVIKCQVPL